MAQLLAGGVIVGAPYTVETLKRLAEESELSAALLIPRGMYEIKPILSFVPQLIADVQNLVGSLEVDAVNYISPYDVFNVTLTAVPSFQFERILNMTVKGPFACFLEDPLPEITDVVDTTRSFEEALRIGVSPWWAPNSNLSNN